MTSECDPLTGPSSFNKALQDLIIQQPATPLSSLEAFTRLRAYVRAYHNQVFQAMATSGDDRWFAAFQNLDLLAAAEQTVFHVMGGNQGTCYTTVAPSALLADKGAGAAWLGCMATWGKYASWVLQQLSYASGNLVLGLAVAQLASFSVVCSAAAPQAAAAMPLSGTAEEAATAAAAQRLGSMLLPVIMVAARALFLVAKVLASPAEHGLAAAGPQARPRCSSSSQETLQDIITRQDSKSLARLHQQSMTLMTAAGCLDACLTAVQLVMGLLPHMPNLHTRHAAVAGTPKHQQVGERGSADGSKHRVPALTPQDLRKLQQLGAECITALLAAKAQLDTAVDSTVQHSESASANHGRPENLLKRLEAGGCCGSSCTSAIGSNPAAPSSQSEPPGLPHQLHRLAEALLSKLPSHKVCANPACTQLTKLSEKELCVRQCSSCGTAYCSKECSQEHWKQHKALCRRVAAARHPENAGSGPQPSPVSAATKKSKHNRKAQGANL